MLSNIGRSAIRRAGAGTSNTSTNRLLQSIWQLHRVNNPEKIHDASFRSQFSLPLRRLYATVTKATSADKPRARAAGTKTKTAKKAAPKKAVKKPKKKAVKPKKKIAKKPKPRAKKILTDEQKTKVAERKERQEVKALKATALLSERPKVKPSTAWMALVSEHAGTGNFQTHMKEAAAKYKALSAEELERYNHIANRNTVDNANTLKTWIESHTVDQIRLANNARLLLNRKIGKTKHYHLKDDRAPKRPVTSYSRFVRDRWATGDFKGITLADSSQIINRDWSALSDVARKEYEAAAELDRQRYKTEYRTVYNRDPPNAATA